MSKNSEMTFLEHLEELRWHIMRSIIAVAIFAIIAFIFKEFVFDQLLLAPKNPDFITNRIFFRLGQLLNMESLFINQRQLHLINIDLSGQFSTHVAVSAYLGFVAAFPYVLWEFWRFIKPALFAHERRYARGAVFYISMLFLLGVFFGYYLIIPISIEFFGGYFVSPEVANMINLDSFITTMASTILACGLVFEMPVLIYFLSRIGLITPQFLRKYRRHAIVVILTIAAIITPPDVFSQLIVSIPLFILYEAGILISNKVQKSKMKKLLDRKDL